MLLLCELGYRIVTVSTGNGKAGRDPGLNLEGAQGEDSSAAAQRSLWHDGRLVCLLGRSVVVEIHLAVGGWALWVCNLGGAGWCRLVQASVEAALHRPWCTIGTSAPRRRYTNVSL